MPRSAIDRWKGHSAKIILGKVRKNSLNHSRIKLFIIKFILSILLGAIGVWMILGTYPFWLKFDPIARCGVFLAVFLVISVGFFLLLRINQRVLIGLNKKSELTMFLMLGTLFAFMITLGFRHEIPFSFSYSVIPQKIEIIPQNSAAASIDCPSTSDFDISIKPGLVKFHPFMVENDLCGMDQKGKNLSIQYNFFKNRLTTKPILSYTGPQENNTIRVNSTTLQQPLIIDFSQTGNLAIPLLLTKERSAYYFVYAIDLAFTFLCLISLIGLASRFFSLIKTFSINLLRLTARILSIFSNNKTILQVLPIFILIAGISLFAETLLNSLAWFFSISSAILFSLMLLAIFRIKSWPVYIIGFFLLTFANTLLVTQLAGIAGLLDHSLTLVGFHLVFLIVVLIIYLRANKPPLLPPMQQVMEEELFEQMHAFGKKSPELLWLSVATAICYLTIMLLIIKVPSNIDDILTTYLPRAGFWIQQGSFKFWPVSTYNLPQVVYPLNGQLPLAWLIKLWGNDKLAGFLQYVSIPMGLAGIFGVSQILGATKKQSFFAGLFFLGLPEIVILSSTALTDLLVANFSISIIYLFLKGINNEDQCALNLSSVALGIILGIKQTSFFFIPGLSILGIILFITKGKRILKPLLQWGGIVFLSFMILSSFIYFRNYIVFGNLFGPNELTPYFTHQDINYENANFLIRGARNLTTFLSRSFFDNLPAPVIQALENSIFLHFYDWELFRDCIPRNTYHISVAWSGQIGFILFVTTFFFCLVHSIKHKKWIALGLILMVLSNTLILLFIRKFTISSTRYFIMPLIILVPMIFLVIKNRSIQNILIINSVIMMTGTLLFDGGKPLVGQNAIWDKTQNEMRNLQFFDDYLPAFEAVDKYLPENSTIAIWLPIKFPQSYLFGSNYTRTVIQLNPEDNRLTLSELQSKNVEYLLVDTNLIASEVSLPNLAMVSDDPALTFVIYKVPPLTSTGADQP